MNILDFLEYGEKVNNYIEDATDTGTGNDKFDSTTLQQYEVPAGKRWLVIGGQVTRDNASTVIITARDSADKIISEFKSSGSGTGTEAWPSGVDNEAVLQPSVHFILDEAEYINVAFGTAQGAGAHCSCIVVEVDI